MRNSPVSDIKAIIEKARFSVAERQPFEAYMVKGKNVAHGDRRTSFEMLFSIKDLLVDAVMKDLRPTPKVNTWQKHIPLEVIEYCYQMVPYRRMSFVWDVREDGRAKFDWVVCVFPDNVVKRPTDYDMIYQRAMAEAGTR